jgi:hypothetical protein
MVSDLCWTERLPEENKQDELLEVSLHIWPVRVIGGIHPGRAVPVVSVDETNLL